MTIPRRDFLGRVASGALGLSLWSAASASSPTTANAMQSRDEPSAPPQRAPGHPKIGSVSWNYHAFRGGTDPSPAIDRIGLLGFEGIDLILLARDDIARFWTDERIGDIARQLDEHRLQLAQFVIFQPVVEGLTSSDPDTRAKNLDFFEAGCKIGKRLGAPLINIVSPWARELKGPGKYLPRYLDLPQPRAGEKYHIDIAPSYDWDAIWQHYVDVTRACLERVKAHGMRLSIEHHTHCVIPDASSFLRLWDAIQDAALGYNLDTGWTLSQREYPPVAIHKVKHQLFNLHLRDVDGLLRSFIHAGTGVMDFKAIVDTLKRVGFDAFMSLEQDKYPGDMDATCKRTIAMLKEYRG